MDDVRNLRQMAADLVDDPVGATFLRSLAWKLERGRCINCGDAYSRGYSRGYAVGVEKGISDMEDAQEGRE